MDGWTDGWMDGQIDRQIDRQTDGQTDKQTGRWTDTSIDKPSNRDAMMLLKEKEGTASIITEKEKEKEIREQI